MRLLSLVAAAAFSAAAGAQCATLTVSGSGATGTDLTITLSATPMSFATVLIGETAGTLPINAGPFSFELGLLPPFLPFPVGMTDASGDASLTLTVPAGVPAADLLGQAAVLGFGRPPNVGLNVCVSNVVTFHVGD